MTLRDLEERLAEFRARGAGDNTRVRVKLDGRTYSLFSEDFYLTAEGVILDV